MVRAKGASDDVLRKVLFELEHRTTAGARRLKNSLLNARPHLANEEKLQAPTPTTKRASRQSGKGSQSPVAQAAIVYEENAVAYEFLRNTFTEEGEILARWGITPTLPESIQMKVFEMWREHLNKNKDPMFRTLEQLGNDQLKLQKLQKGKSTKAGGK